MNMFLKTLRWQLYTCRRQYMMTFFGVATGFFCLMMLFTFGGVDSVPFSALPVCGIMLPLFCLAYYGSQVMADVGTRQRRASYLMLPAGRGVKFLARTVTIFCVALVSIAAAFVVADVAQMVVGYLFWGKAASFMVAHVQCAPQMMPELYDDEAMAVPAVVRVENVVLTVAGQLQLFTFFALGGYLFRKWSMVLTVMATSVASTLLSYVLMRIGMALVESGVDLSFSPEIDSLSLALVVLILISLCFTALHLALSYLLFRRMPLMPGKWLNV